MEATTEKRRRVPGANAGVVERLLLLVGGNPLPNYLAAVALDRHIRAAGGCLREIVLAYTNQVEPIQGRLAESLARAGFTCRPWLVDAHSALQVIESARTLFEDVGAGLHVHYTGGTNVMAVHMRAEWQRMNGDDADDRSSYLYGREEQLLIDSGAIFGLDGVRLDLSTLLSIHGIDLCRVGHSFAGGSAPECSDAALPGLEHARRIAELVRKNPSLAGEMYARLHTESRNKAPREGTVIVAEIARLKLSDDLENLCRRIESDSQVRKSWWAFLKGTWLDLWMGDLVHGRPSPRSPEGRREVSVSVEGRLVQESVDRRPVEIDVVVIAGYRPFFISCTTEPEEDLCRGKLAEILMRSKQLGGDLARPGLVCFAERDVVERLNRDAGTASLGVRPPLIFGWEDFVQWGAGTGFERLDQWLAG